MTQPEFNFDAPARETLTEQVADLLRRHPNVWIDCHLFADIAGIGGWRTRISNCRTELGMTIENRVIKWELTRRNRSQYCYRPSGAQRSGV
jgi:hypothetical protein